MVEHLRKTPAKKNKTLNIAGNEISSILNIDEPYAIAREKFELLRQYCLKTLGITEDNSLHYKTYNRVMNHYLRNSGCYFLDTNNYKDSTKKELTESKKDYTLFLSVIERVGTLTEQQKDIFLQGMKNHFDTDNSKVTENVIIVIDRILSSIEQQKKL